MPPPQVLQPVLKLKVDELFLNWLSDPETQLVLKEYLDQIKNGQYRSSGGENSQADKSLSFNENNNIASQKNLVEKKPASLGNPSGSASNSTLPSGSNSNSRVPGPGGRLLRRSVSSKKVSPFYDVRLLTHLMFKNYNYNQDLPSQEQPETKENT